MLHDFFIAKKNFIFFSLNIIKYIYLHYICIMWIWIITIVYVLDSISCKIQYILMVRSFTSCNVFFFFFSAGWENPNPYYAFLVGFIFLLLGLWSAKIVFNLLSLLKYFSSSLFVNYYYFCHFSLLKFDLFICPCDDSTWAQNEYMFRFNWLKELERVVQ